jgi:hypothetical protein
MNAITNTLGNKVVEVYDSSIVATIKDYTLPLISLFLSQKLNDVTIVSGGIRGSEQLTLEDEHGFVAGNFIEIWQNGYWQQIEITNVDENVVDLLLPLGFDVSETASVKRVNVNMAVNGSVTAVDFTFKPQSDDLYDINMAIGNITHALAADDSKFGSIAALTNGVVFSKINPSLNYDFHLFNIRRNADLRIRMYELDYNDKAGAGLYNTYFRKKFNGRDNNNVAIRVDALRGDYIVAKIRDNLTTLSSFRITIQGHLSLRLNTSTL